jgi:hypothetical protein
MKAAKKVAKKAAKKAEREAARNESSNPFETRQPPGPKTGPRAQTTRQREG